MNRSPSRPEIVTRRIEAFHRLRADGLISREPLFFPAQQYPPITMYPPATQEELFRGYTNPADDLFVVYVHFPFCQQQCPFCAYPNRIGATSDEKDRYIDALAREMDIYMELLGLAKIRARSILVGGGTPTYLSPAQLERFLTQFDARVDRTHCAQFSYDVDPVTLLGSDGAARLAILRDHGVDRLTIGMQSLVPETLQRMGRHHTVDDSVLALGRSKDFGFLNNIEFIYGYPGDTMDGWMRTVKGAVALEADEIQIYQMKIIPYGDHQTAILRQFQQGKLPDIHIDEILAMKAMAIKYFEETGYKEDLDRVYTKNKTIFSQYQHDQCYMLFDQIGFGTKAHSSLRDRFILNSNDYSHYFASIEENRLPINRGLVRSEDDALRFSFVLPLKNRTLIKSFFKKTTGRDVADFFRTKRERLARHGLIVETDEEISLTDLGRFFTADVCRQFYHPRYLPFPRSAYAEGELSPYLDWEL